MSDKNRYMRILTGIAIILVVLGHVDWNILSVFGIFPYYSFHVLVFVFVSGYFYKTDNEGNILAYIKKKALHLLVPYYIWNLVYGVASTLAAGKGFIFCSKMNWFNYLVEPFLGGHQYGFNFAAWFVPALFVIEIIYVLGRKVLTVVRMSNEFVIFLVLLAAGIATVYFAQTGHVWGYLKTPGRILFMLPVYHLGRMYNLYIEKYDTLPSYIYLPVVTVLEVIAYMVAGGALNFSAVWCTSFMSFPFMPYVTIVLGIAFWLRIARLLSGIKIGRIIEFIGDYSFSVMMHHVFFIFLINTIIYLISTGTGGISFDMIEYKENINYVFTSGVYAVWKCIYSVVPIGASVAVGMLLNSVKVRNGKRINK